MIPERRPGGRRCCCCCPCASNLAGERCSLLLLAMLLLPAVPTVAGLRCAPACRSIGAELKSLWLLLLPLLMLLFNDAADWEEYADAASCRAFFPSARSLNSWASTCCSLNARALHLSVRKATWPAASGSWSPLCSPSMLWRTLLGFLTPRSGLRLLDCDVQGIVGMHTTKRGWCTGWFRTDGDARRVCLQCYTKKKPAVDGGPPVRIFHDGMPQRGRL